MQGSAKKNAKTAKNGYSPEAQKSAKNRICAPPPPPVLGPLHSIPQFVTFWGCCLTPCRIIILGDKIIPQ